MLYTSAVNLLHIEYNVPNMGNHICARHLKSEWEQSDLEVCIHNLKLLLEELFCQLYWKVVKHITAVIEHAYVWCLNSERNSLGKGQKSSTKILYLFRRVYRLRELDLTTSEAKRDRGARLGSIQFYIVIISVTSTFSRGILTPIFKALPKSYQ
ncbi:hypothetical protein WA026_009497 [Henosepilachna vigintioctopunctata]|uniref:Uncharacterized protein n=1 Tax=Henosepilachna vigintioctopunctata TaxID=420089 RepID=A0AAW1U433_9CUCU